MFSPLYFLKSHFHFPVVQLVLFLGLGYKCRIRTLLSYLQAVLQTYFSKIIFDFLINLFFKIVDGNWIFFKCFTKMKTHVCNSNGIMQSNLQILRTKRLQNIRFLRTKLFRKLIDSIRCSIVNLGPKVIIDLVSCLYKKKKWGQFLLSTKLLA